MRIDDDGELHITIARPDGTEANGRVPVYEALNTYFDLAKPTNGGGTEFWNAWAGYLETFGLNGISHRACELVSLAVIQRAGELQKKGLGSQSAS